jgi:hypothetical protein
MIMRISEAGKSDQDLLDCTQRQLILTTTFLQISRTIGIYNEIFSKGTVIKGFPSPSRRFF